MHFMQFQLIQAHLPLPDTPHLPTSADNCPISVWQFTVMVAGLQMLVGQLRDLSQLDRLVSIIPFMLGFIILTSVVLAGVQGEYV